MAALEKITKQHADTLTRAMTELREVGVIESAEAEVYAARTSADQRIAIAEARLAEEIQRRRDAESERDAARADRDQPTTPRPRPWPAWRNSNANSRSSAPTPSSR